MTPWLLIAGIVVVVYIIGFWIAMLILHEPGYTGTLREALIWPATVVFLLCIWPVLVKEWWLTRRPKKARESEKKP